MVDKYSILPPTGSFPNKSWIENPNMQQGLDGKISAAGWTYGNEGFVQQTFLGASIRNFSIVAGFGDTSSTLTVNLINDEYNVSDKTGLGLGDDVYHNGLNDFFRPPPVGSPVFFKFGKNHATIEQAWRRYLDTIAGINTLDHKETVLETPIISTINLRDGVKQGYLYDIENKNFKDVSNLRPDDETTYSGDDLSNVDGMPDDKYHSRGKNHIIFGGILQSYNQTKGIDGNPLYSVTVVDPREILSSVEVVLSNYAGSMYDNKNFINVYGFLEYDPSDSFLQNQKSVNIPGYCVSPIESIDTWATALPFTFLGLPFNKDKNVIEKIVDPNNGTIKYFGNDMFRNEKMEYNYPDEGGTLVVGDDNQEEDQFYIPEFFPMTGEGMSRRCEQGIPWYRVRQALQAMFEYIGPLPEEYVKEGFGGPIDFRGFNYVVDFSGLPLEKIPQMYFLDFEQINLLSLLQEICDVISHDLYVTLIPVINHPQYLNLYLANRAYIQNKQFDKVVAGVIRVEAINRSDAPRIGAIKDYIEELKNVKGIEVENQNLGYELTNVSTDKMVVGAQQVDMYFFSDNKDRDFLQKRLFNAGQLNSFESYQQDQWTLDSSLEQQILPFYGFIGKNVPTIPRGWGAYQQILLDATGLDADGVGNYYVATEIELRAAAISYEQWSRFLLQYNELYIEEFGKNSIFYRALEDSAVSEPQNLPDPVNSDTDLIDPEDPPEWLNNRTFGVSVPRCVFISEKNYVAEDNLPASPCSPPFGYPLYYKRAEKIGIPEAGVVKYQGAIFEIISNYEKLVKEAKKDGDLLIIKQEVIDKYLNDLMQKFEAGLNGLSIEERNEWLKQFAEIKKASEDVKTVLQLKNLVSIVRKFFNSEKNATFIKTVNRLAKKHLKNAKRIHKFLKDIADENLGKKFLVKIPKAANLLYNDEIKIEGVDGEQTIFVDDGPTDAPLETPSWDKINNIQYGPFGFPPILSPFQDTSFRYLENNEEKNNYVTKNLLDDEFSLETILDHQLRFFNWQWERMSAPLCNECHYYTNGALKVNFNPISDNWEFNYKPESQGGFFPFAQFPNNLSYSPTQLAGFPFGEDVAKQTNEIITLGQKQFLIPMDLSNFESNGRISAYVRYDHSQDLDLSSIGKNNFTQQERNPNANIPDVMEELGNITPDRIEILDQISERINDGQRKEYVAFVKCDLDENLYLLPKLEELETDVFARETMYVPNTSPIRPIEIIDESGCKKIVKSKPYILPVFTIAESGGISEGVKTNVTEFERVEFAEFPNAKLIETRKERLGTDYVYALITLPNRINPTIDKRFVDGPYQIVNGVDIKHLLTQDVVHAPSTFRFDKPIDLVGKTVPVDCDKFTFTQLTNAQSIQKITLQKVAIADPQIRLGFLQPSPIYPNLVVLPLLSRERCYGPWFSSSIVNGYSNSGLRYKNIGGKVEFVKDENLSPWNYAGYSLMNEAGALKAQFSNSLLLFSENGGITYPDAPNGVDLAKPLNFSGPLVTSISVDISTESVKTNIKMDLYTSRFGKLNKQKENLIGQIAREKQKLIEQKNYLIRRGFGKSFSNNDILSQIRQNGGGIINLAQQTNEIIDSVKLGMPLPDTIVVSLQNESEKVSVDGKPITVTSYTQSASVQDQQRIAEMFSLIGNENDPNTLNRVYSQTAGTTYSEFFTGYSTLSIGSQNSIDFPSLPYSNKYIEQRERT